jgi:hypothetical protein
VREEGKTWDFAHELKANPEGPKISCDGKRSREYIYAGDSVDGMRTGHNKGGRPLQPRLGG